MLESILNLISDFITGYSFHLSNPSFTFDWIMMTIALTIWAFCIVMFYGTLSYLILSGTTKYIMRAISAARSLVVEKYSSMVSSK